jgi:hypothetical protein
LKNRRAAYREVTEAPTLNPRIPKCSLTWPQFSSVAGNWIQHLKRWHKRPSPSNLGNCRARLTMGHSYILRAPMALEQASKGVR